MKGRADQSLIQTLVPKHLGAWVNKQATADGVSVAAWLRRLVMAARVRKGGGE